MAQQVCGVKRGRGRVRRWGVSPSNVGWNLNYMGPDTVYGFAARTPDEALLAAGAHKVFSEMSALPALVSAGLAQGT